MSTPQIDGCPSDFGSNEPFWLLKGAKGAQMVPTRGDSGPALDWEPDPAGPLLGPQWVGHPESTLGSTPQSCSVAISALPGRCVKSSYGKSHPKTTVKEKK